VLVFHFVLLGGPFLLLLVFVDQGMYFVLYPLKNIRKTAMAGTGKHLNMGCKGRQNAI